MTKIVSKKLPHAIGYADIRDVITKQKVMLLVENIQLLHSQLMEAQRALIELQSIAKSRR